MKELIKFISKFEYKRDKIYWIKALKVSDTVKGKLINHFRLG